MISFCISNREYIILSILSEHKWFNYRIYLKVFIKSLHKKKIISIVLWNKKVNKSNKDGLSMKKIAQRPANIITTSKSPIWLNDLTLLESGLTYSCRVNGLLRNHLSSCLKWENTNGNAQFYNITKAVKYHITKSQRPLDSTCFSFVSPPFPITIIAKFMKRKGENYVVCVI